MKSNQLVSTLIEGQIKLSSRFFPKVYQPGISNSFIFLQEYFQKNHQKILNQLSQEGALFFRGFNIKSANEMASILNKLGISSFQYIGGAAVRNLIIGSTNRRSENVQVFTTNQSPPHQPIPFHNELMQNQNYPDFLSFYCYRQADTGGSTPIVSCQQLYNFIAQRHSEFLKKLEKLKLRYIRVVGKQDNPSSPIGRGWKNIFKCETKQQAEKKMAETGYEWEWLNNEDQDCRLISKPIPGVRISKSGKKVFCNQFAVFKGWIDNKNQPSKALRYGDFSQISLEALQSIYKHSYQIKAAIPWKVGDFILIDNQMAMHSRQPFTGINRKIYASLFKGLKPTKQGLHLTLKSGDQMPIVGFGTWKLPNDACQQTVYQAIRSGYKLIDCAATYGNQIEVGRGIKKALMQNIIKRKDLFITSKLWCTFHRPQHVREACLRTLSDLKVQYLDLYLMHFPLPLRYVDPKDAYPTDFQYFPLPKQGPIIFVDEVPLIDTWKAMEQLVSEGLVKNIGVSNFNISLLRELINASKIIPAVHQAQIHPFLTQKKMVRFCQQNGVQVTSYSTFGGASYQYIYNYPDSQFITETQVIKDIAKKYEKTAHQILLRWAIQQGLAVIPKTVKKERLRLNSDIYGWSIQQSDIKLIDQLNRNKRYNDPGAYYTQQNYKDILIWD